MTQYRRGNGQGGTGSSGGGRPKRPMTEAERRERARRRAEAERRKKQNRTIRIFTIGIVVLLIAVIVIVVVSCSNRKNQEPAGSGNAPVPQQQGTTEETTTEAKRSEVELVAVGDVLMHTPLLNYAQQEDGSYDFNHIFSVMKDDISKADIAVCNQETPIDTTIPADGGIEFIFNTPGAIGDAEINAGFDIVQQASNHSYDEGSDGILHTIEFWKTKADQATMIGLNESQEARDTITYYEKNGIKFGLLNYTYGLNGFALPDDMDYLLTIIDDEHKAQIENDIRTAKENSDFVIVFPHWGVEDQWPEPTDFQVEWAKIFADAGADLIIGAHPHVCETIDWVTAEDGRKTLCYYSLGNYASNQQETPEVLGGMAKVKIVKENGETKIDESATGVVPIVTHNVNLGDFTNEVVCYKLSDYTEELASQHDIVTNGRDDFSVERLNDIAKQDFGDWIISY